MKKPWLLPVLGVPLVALLIAAVLLYKDQQYERAQDLKREAMRYWEDDLFRNEDFLDLMDEWHLEAGRKREFDDYIFYPLENPMEENVASLFVNVRSGDVFVKIPGERNMEQGKRYPIEAIGDSLNVLVSAFEETTVIEYTEEELRRESDFGALIPMLDPELIADEALFDEFVSMNWREKLAHYQEYFSQNNPFVELKEDPSRFIAHFNGEDLKLEDAMQFQEFIEVSEGDWLNDWAYALSPDSDELIYSCDALFANLDRQEDYLAGEFQLPAYSISHEEGHLLEVEEFYYSEGDDEIYLKTDCIYEFPFWDTDNTISTSYVLRFEEEYLTDVFSYYPGDVSYWDQTLIEWYQFDYDEEGERNWVRHLRMGNASDQLSIVHMEYEYEQAFEMEIY